MCMEFGRVEAAAYITQVRWTFAKTMPQWPHEYTVREWQPDLQTDFFAFAELIQRDGLLKPWPPEPAVPVYRHAYWELDGWEYWIMGGPVSEAQVINRARV